MQLLIEDPALSCERHGIARLNNREFLYRRPDGPFLFDIYHALYLRLAGLKISLNRGGFPYDKAEYNHKIQKHGIWIYMDIGLVRGKASVDLGFLSVTFPCNLENSWHTYKPRYPNCDQLSPREDQTDIYTLPIKYVRVSNNDRLYQIYCWVDSAMNVEIDSFKSPYIRINEFGFDELMQPLVWKSKSGPLFVDPDDIEPEILPVSARALGKKRLYGEPQALSNVEVVVAVAAEAPIREDRTSPPKKNRVDLDLISDEREEAIRRLMNDPLVRGEAIKRGVDECFEQIVSMMQKNLEESPAKRQFLRDTIRERALNKILAEEGDELRAEVQELLLDQARAARQEIRSNSPKIRVPSGVSKSIEDKINGAPPPTESSN